MPAQLLDHTVDNGQPQSCTLPLRLGGEKRLENPLLHTGRHAYPRVGNREHHILSWHHLIVSTGIVLIQHDILSFYCQYTPLRHRVAGVQKEVRKHLRKLGSVALNQPQVFCQKGSHLNIGR